MAAKIYAICNQKGGCGKTVTSVNLGIGLAREGKKVLLVDVNAQGSLTASLGYRQPDQIETTLAAILGGILGDSPVPPGSGILHHEEGVDLLPANIELSGMEVTLVNMLNQAAGDRQILARQLNISPHQLSYVTNSNAGEGLLFYGNVIIPFC